jgi:hypothetical protein
MEDEFIESALREETRLKRRLLAVQAVIANYREDNRQTPPDDVSSHPPSGPLRTRTSRSQSNASSVIRIAEEHLMQVQRRAPSTELYDEIKRRGIEIPGQNPTGIVASYLSNSDKFDNVRGQGYGLAIWNSARERVHKENEPISDSAVGSDAADEGVQPPNSAQASPNSTPGG